MGTITNLILIAEIGFVTVGSLEAQTHRFDNGKAGMGYFHDSGNLKSQDNPQKPRTLTFAEFVKTNNFPTKNLMDALDDSSFAYQLKKDMLIYGIPNPGVNETLVWKAVGYSNELMKSV
ncbi:MAG: hypothetical protein ABH828_04575 [archaeon]